MHGLHWLHPAPESLIVSYDNYRDVTDIVAVIARVWTDYCFVNERLDGSFQLMIPDGLLHE